MHRIIVIVQKTPLLSDSRGLTQSLKDFQPSTAAVANSGQTTVSSTIGQKDEQYNTRHNTTLKYKLQVLLKSQP